MIVEHIDATVVPPGQIGKAGLLCSPAEVVISELMIVVNVVEVGVRPQFLQSLSGRRQVTRVAISVCIHRVQHHHIMDGVVCSVGGLLIIGGQGCF